MSFLFQNHNDYLATLTDEQELIRRAKGGDFEAFVEFHKSKVYAMIRRSTGCEQDAEDIMQDTLL